MEKHYPLTIMLHLLLGYNTLSTASIYIHNNKHVYTKLTTRFVIVYTHTNIYTHTNVSLLAISGPPPPPPQPKPKPKCQQSSCRKRTCAGSYAPPGMCCAICPQGSRYY